MTKVHKLVIQVGNTPVEFSISDQRLSALNQLSNSALCIDGPTHVNNPEHCFKALGSGRLTFQKGNLVILARGYGGAGGKEEAEIPYEYICPITHLLMLHPVIAADGETYEEEAIAKYLVSNNLSPVHRTQLSTKNLIPNLAIKRRINAFLETNPSAKKELYLPAKLIEDCQQALLAENIPMVKLLTQTEPRLFTHEFNDNQTLLDLAFCTSPSTLQAIVELYPPAHKPPLTDKLCARLAQLQGADGLKILLEAYPAEVSLNKRLFSAIQDTSIDYLKALLELGADPNAVNSKGQSALYAAINADNKDLLSILIQHGADIKKVENGCLSATQYAIQTGKPHLAYHMIFQKRQIKVQPHLIPLQNQVDQLMAMQLLTIQALERISTKLDPKTCQPVQAELTALQLQLANLIAKPTSSHMPNPTLAAKAQPVPPIDTEKVRQSDIIELLNQNFQDLETLLRLYRENELTLNGPQEQTLILHYASAGLLMRLFHLLGIAGNQGQLPPLFNDQTHFFNRPTAYKYRNQLMHHLFKFRGCTLVLINTAKQLQSIGSNIQNLKSTGCPSADPLMELSDLSIHKIAKLTEGVEDMVKDQLRAVEEIDQYALELSILNQQAQALIRQSPALWEHAGLLHLAIGTLSCALGQRIKDIRAYPAYQTIKNKLLSFDPQALETATFGTMTIRATVFEIDRMRFGHTYNYEGLAPGRASAKALRQAAFELITPDKLLQRMTLASQLAKESPNRQEPLPFFFREANPSFASLHQQLQSLSFPKTPRKPESDAAPSGSELAVKLADASESSITNEPETTCPQNAIDPSSSAPPVPDMAFGKAKWAQYFGDIGQEPALPPNIEEILNRPCPIQPEKKVRDTHLLTLIPSHVSGKELDTVSIEKLKPHWGPQVRYRSIYHSPPEEPSKVSQNIWVLMHNSAIYFGKNDDKLCRKMKELREASGLDYQIPNLIEVVTSIVMDNIPHRKIFFMGTTLCAEKSTVNGKTYHTAVTYSEGVYIKRIDASDIGYGSISPVVRLSS
ncbi:MAG: ankyrin repeat domain-containing protein [Chlamydiales bacterium]|nr:ankyrin repeat domain-containing protein [Chlamydiales bacterium]